MNSEESGYCDSRGKDSKVCALSFAKSDVAFSFGRENIVQEFMELLNQMDQVGTKFCITTLIIFYSVSERNSTIFLPRIETNQTSSNALSSSAVRRLNIQPTPLKSGRSGHYSNNYLPTIVMVRTIFSFLG